ISTTHLNEALMRTKDNPIITYQYQTARHYYAMGGYKFVQLGGGDGDIDIQALVRTDLTKVSSDINVRYIWRNMLYGGITYRTIDAVGIMVGGTWSNITLGYAYDVTTNKLAGVSRG